MQNELEFITNYAFINVVAEADKKLLGAKSIAKSIFKIRF